MAIYKDNVPGFPGYHVTRSGKVYSKSKIMAEKKLPRLNEEFYARYEDGRFTFYMGIEDSRSKRYIKEGKDLMVSHNEGYATVVGPLNLEDLKALRKIIRKAIRNYESNEPIQI